MEWESLVGLGFIVVMLGVFLIIVGVILAAMHGGEGKGEGEVGGVIIIGPIPIVFGSSGRAAIIAALLGALLMVLAIAFMIIARRPPG
ncbi:MAG: DUF131 domain-containing protein [Desulfurococcales archaeon]|nr:DUF131 domain-containing protein [Desulfurococcales archaeon]